MQKLSRPYQIALGGLVLFALAWFTVLKPSDVSSAQVAALPPTIPASPASAVPGASGLGRAVAKATAAKDTANATARAAAARGADPITAVPASGATGAAKPTSATAGSAVTRATPAPAADVPPADPSAPILRDVARGKIGVLLFFSRQSTDDRAVRRALRRADRHDGRVVVRAASISRVADYTAITEGVKITQAPSLLVIGHGGRTRMIVGFTDTAAIDQLVADVGGPAFTARRARGYRGRVANICAVVGQSLAGNVLPGPDLADRLAVLRADLVDARRTVAGLHTPKRYAAFQRSFTADLGVLLAATQAALAAPVPAVALRGFDARAAAAGKKVRSAARHAGLPAGC